MFFKIFFLTFTVCFCLTWITIKLAAKVQNPVRNYVPATENEKVKISPFGGVCIFASVLFTSFFFMPLKNLYLLFPTFCMLILGLIDDLQKVFSKNWRGISAKMKFSIQSLVTIIVCLGAFKLNPDFSRFVLIVPFYKTLTISLFLPLAFVISYFAFTGTVNAVNLTDGLDGLAGKQMLAILTFLGTVLLKMDFSAIKVFSSSVSMLVFSLLGATLAFLCFNSNPAKIFMGDSGSMAYGAFIASAFILFKIELMLILIGFIIFMEALSVIIQVSYFKYTKGKRIFRMSPLHHHFQLCGMKEQKISEIAFFITILIGVFIISTLF